MQPDSSVHVTEWGNGPRVVCVHGGTPGGGAVAFANQKELEARWHLVVPDRPGHGQSPRQGREDFERDAEVLGPLLEDRAHLVGASYGAMAALYMAARRPDVVSSLTLIEPPAFSFGAGNAAVDEMARATRELFDNPPADPVQIMNTFFALVGIDMQIPVPAPEPFLPIAQAFADDMGNMRGPDEGHVDAADLTRGGYPIQVLTSGHIAGFEGIASAIVEQTGAAHFVVPDTDHTMQSAGPAVNKLLEQLWSTAEADTP